MAKRLIRIVVMVLAFLIGVLIGGLVAGRTQEPEHCTERELAP